MATEFEKLTVTQLRSELKRRKLATTGLKAALVARLVEDEAGQTAEVDETADGETPADEAQPKNDGTPAAETERNDDVAMDDAPVEDNAPAEKATSPAPEAPSSVPEPANSDTPKAEQEAAPESTDTDKHGDVAMDDAPVTAPEKSTSPSPPSPAKEAMPEAALEAVSKLDTTAQPESANEPEVANQQGSIPPVSEILETEPSAVTEVVQDIVSRKRRSRSPPPSGDESSSKRARQDDWEKKESEESRNEQGLPANKHLGEITPFEVVAPRSPETRFREESPPHKRQQRAWGQRLEDNQPRYQEQNMDIDTPLDEFGRIERSRHPATSALYIKNFMRPLKELQVREYLVQLAAFPGAPPNDACISDFHVDRIRTHALVKFDSVSAASRVRTALHGKVWPNESTRKELWVDFIPAEKVGEWIGMEEDSPRQARWEVIYEEDPDTQEVVASLVEGGGADTGNSRNSRPARQPLGPPAVPTGPGRRFPELQGPPSGPRVRGRGQAKHDLDNFDNMKMTSTGPSIYYQPVSEELAQRRLENMRSYYTQDRHRDMGREDEINRYTFENRSQFVDRGKEVFIGIRHPIREARKRRERNELRRGGGRRTPSPPLRRQDDRAYRVRDDRAGGGGGGNWSRDRFEDLDREDDHSRRGGYGDDDNGPMVHPDRLARVSMERTMDDHRRWDKGDNDVPRSRFDGAPLPTYTGPPRNNNRRRGGGGGGRNRR
ncbi:hypothetical protein QBC40DRAFT_74619 [Triangularia verruculosa]|uniref:SAP domain-containing protein n=1 Tax=Triangularia verruculosa TaxID=2587418 RepID=A0AAN6XUN7_9PEZI|nr:hypothetical protein QBC40DRAFT_74619 [Triangularia verruculosa]